MAGINFLKDAHKITSLSLSSDLKCLSVVCSSPSNVHHLQLIDTSLLWQRNQEIRELSAQYTHITTISKLCNESIRDMQTKWKDALQSFSQKFDKDLSQLLKSINKHKNLVFLLLKMKELKELFKMNSLICL